MSEQTHDKCSHFSYRQCEKRDDEIMQRATQDIPQYLSGNMPQMAMPPTDEEINALCASCAGFKSK